MTSVRARKDGQCIVDLTEVPKYLKSIPVRAVARPGVGIIGACGFQSRRLPYVHTLKLEP